MPLRTPTKLHDRVPDLTKPCLLAQNKRGFLSQGPISDQNIMEIRDGFLWHPIFGDKLTSSWKGLGWYPVNIYEYPNEPTFIIRNPYAT